MTTEEKVSIVGIIFLIILTSLNGCSSLFVIDNKEPEEEKVVKCEILREKDTPLRGIECTQLNDEIVAVKLYLVEKVIHVHPTRVRWKDKNPMDQLEKELLKPWKE